MTRVVLILIACTGCRINFDEHDDRRAFVVDEFSTTSTEFVDIPGGTLTIPVSPGSTWLLQTSAAISSTNIEPVTVEARYLVDGIERGIGGTQNSVPDRPGPWEHFYVLLGSTVEQHLVYQLRDASGGTAKIEQLHAIAVRLPPGAAPHYQSSDDAQLVTATTLGPQVTFSLGPLSGRYVVFLLVNASDRPAQNDCYVQWRGPSGEILLQQLQQPREPWQSMFAVRVLELDTPDATLTLDARAGIGGPAQVRNVRAFAMRADAFETFAFDHTMAMIDAVSPDVSIGPVVTPGPGGAASAYLYVASTVGKEDCVATIDTERRYHFIVDDDDTTIAHVTDNCAYWTTYGVTRLLDHKPTQLALGVSSGNAQQVWMSHPAILLLGLPP